MYMAHAEVRTTSRAHCVLLFCIGRSANHNDDEEYIPVTRSTQVVDGAPLTVSAHQESNINATPLCTPNERTGCMYNIIIVSTINIANVLLQYSIMKV